MYYLLDTIHEDLNRVLNKPLTDPIEANDKSDFEVGKESWQAFLERNRSIIVDLMYGQFKSTIQCSQCKGVSKFFETFSICSIPIPNQKEIETFLVFENYSKKPYRMLLKYPDEKHTLKDLKESLGFLLDKKLNTLQFGIGDKYSFTPLHDLNITTSQISQSLLNSYLITFELTKEEMDIPTNRRVYIGLQTLKADLVEEPKSVIGVIKMIVIDKNMNNKEVHLHIFSKYRFMFDQNWPFRSDKPYEDWPIEKACDEAFTRFKRPLYEVLITSGRRQKVQEELIEYNDNKILSILDRFKNPEEELLIQVQWLYFPSFVDLYHLESVIRFDPYKSGINNKENSEKKFTSIEECLRSFAQPEELDESNAWYCKQCRKHQNAIKKLELYKIPKIFIIHLKRFKTGDNTRWNRTESKINDLITFPVEDFNLASFISNRHLPEDYFGKEANYVQSINGSQSDLKYDLIGVIHHVGNLNSGHYIAHCKNSKTNEWYVFDDDRVRKVESTAEVVADTAYILFYKRK